MSPMFRLFVIVLAIVFTSSASRAQALFEVSTDQKVAASGLIIEGKVTGKRSYWNPQHTMIFTSNDVEVYKVFKGSLQKNTIQVITTGGTVDHYTIIASDLLQLEPDDVGVFYCEKNTAATALSKQDAYDVYSSAQGFLKYDLVTRTASAPFVKYNDIEKQLYSELARKTGKQAEIKNRSFSVERISKAVNRTEATNITLAPAVASFSPTTVTGGTFQDAANNVLTISGSGFENNPSGQAAVEFSHADKGPGSFFTVPYDTSLILSWTDTQIKLMVPTAAGSGVFRVRNSAGVVASAASALKVLYTVLSAQPFARPVQFNLVNENKSGGYSIKYSSNTANQGKDINSTDAKGTVQRALNTWKELTGVNFAEAGSTSNQKVDVNDGENIIVFDNSASGLGGPLPNGVLATCYSGLGYCSDTSKPFFKNGFDVVLRNEGYSSGSVNFTYGPCSPFTSTSAEVDLETVLLHELGHALNLGHIIASQQGPGIVGDENPGKVMNYSITYNLRRISPDYSAMQGAAYTVNSKLGSAYGTCLPSGNADMTPLAVHVDTHDACPAVFPTAATPSLTSVAFDLAHCTSNVNEDPDYKQLLSDGTGTSITNTAFYAFMTGDAGGNLTLDIKNYTTTPTAIASCTPAPTIPVTGVQLSIYQVSACPGGGNFPTLFFNTTFSGNGTVAAVNGLTANSTYLMVLDGVENTKAAFIMVFSGTALPKPTSTSSFSVYPNPISTQSMNVQILNQDPGAYTLVMYNTLGQQVAQKAFTVGSSSELQTLSVSALSAGVYRLSLIGPDKKRIKTIAVAVTK